MNPDTKITVEIVRAKADDLGRSSHGLCGLCS